MQSFWFLFIYEVIETTNLEILTIFATFHIWNIYGLWPSVQYQGYLCLDSKT